MKISKKMENPKEFYEEFLYITLMYSKLKKHPRKKASKITTFLINTESLVLIFVVLAYRLDSDESFLVGAGIASLLVWVISFTIISRQIKNFVKLNDEGTEGTVEINQKEIEVMDDEKTIQIKWESIEYIIVNKYSISFIPKKDTGLFCSIGIDYKDEMIKALKKYKKEDLLIDNSDLY